MRRKTILMTVLIGFALLAALAVWQSLQAQMPGGPGGPPGAPGGGGNNRGFSEMMVIMQALPLDGMWTQVSFELGVSDDVLVKARKAFQEAWNERKTKITDKMEDARGDADAMRTIKTDADKIKSNLDAKLKGILTADQAAKLAKWESESKNRMRRAPGAVR